jgi:hypothetical protein
MNKAILIFVICLQVAPNFAQLTRFTCKENGHGYKDNTGKEIIPCLNYSSAYRGGNEIVLTFNGKLIFYDATTGKEISNGKYDGYKDDFGIFKEGFAAVNLGGEKAWGERDFKGGKWGFIDRNGKELTPIKYDSVAFFNDGIAVVCLGGKQGIINLTGKEIIPPKYNKIDDFEYGRAKAFLNGQEKWIDREGNVINPEEIEFKNINYQDALTLSKQTNKPIFLVCSNGGCCRSTGIEKTLKNQDVGSYFNSNFICLKVPYNDIDSKIINTITDNGYVNLPALFFINSNGDLIRKSTADGDCDSYIKDKELINMAKLCVTKGK